ncbi:threonine/serine dehydratase [Pseudarthrobacter sp. NPDC058196]|uniref:threonine/serine dehydratase n=1 Tax=Pseudarthrobacter sp. NPDC058196 TaxID=3346376 RepID=UPI0036DAB57B
MITKDDIDQAARRTAGLIRKTPVMAADRDEATGQVWFKCEFMQHTGTFKARGALNRILASKERGELRADVGVVVASGGNAGLANAYAAAQLGVPATVFVPEAAPAVKVHKLKAIGATVVQGGAEYAAAYQAAVAHAAKTGAVYCHAYDQREIAAGAGTVGSELLEQLPDVDTILVAVEPATAPTLHAALAAGEPVDVAVSGVAADSLGARRIGDIGFSVAVRCGVESVLVSDEQIVAARSALWNDYRIGVEHGAAAAYAALAAGAYVPRQDERVAVILCGANTDPATL